MPKQRRKKGNPRRVQPQKVIIVKYTEADEEISEIYSSADAEETVCAAEPLTKEIPEEIPSVIEESGTVPPEETDTDTQPDEPVQPKEEQEKTEVLDPSKTVQPLPEQPSEIKTEDSQMEKEDPDMKKKSEPKKKQSPWRFAWFLTFVLFYYELLLHMAAGLPYTWQYLLAVILFCGAHAVLVHTLTSLSKKPTRNRTARLVIMTATAVFFLVCFFVHKQFKVFYDLKTMTAGASDALGQFQQNVFALILSDEGMASIILYFVPLVLYAKFGSKFDGAKKIRGGRWFLSLLTSIALFVCSIGSVYFSPVWGTFWSEYNFQNAIGSFGLITATELDLRKNLLPASLSGFEPTYTKLIHTTEAGGQEKLVWNKNEMEFDWESLEASANSTEKNLDEYLSSLVPSRKNDYTGLFEGKNLIMITAEAFTAEVIDEDLTPTLWRMAHKGINFNDYYQPATAGTTGGEYEIVFGMLPTNGGSSFKNMTDRNNYMTMGSQLNRLGYEGWAFHNNTYTFYDRHLTHNSLGYSNGFMGYGNGMEDYVTWQWPQSDLEMIEGTLPLYENAEHFNVYYMSVSGHNGYDYGTNAMTDKNWDKVQDLDYSGRVKGYIACNLELESAMEYLVNRLEELGIADDTVIVISADHFPYGLDDGAGFGNMTYLSELYGYNVTDYLSRDHNRLIIWSGCLEDEEPIVVDSPVSSLDILPTLSNLFGTEFDSRLFPGRDVFSDAEPLVFTMYYDWKTNLGTYNSITGEFTPKEGVNVPDGYVDRIKKAVRNKIQYCTGFNDTDYYGHLFGQ